MIKSSVSRRTYILIVGINHLIVSAGDQNEVSAGTTEHTEG